jgi:ATP/maltotriose-dependent transcriptional regulator MalT
MAEIRAADPRLTVEEARAILDHSMVLGLSDEDLVSPGDRTEEWAAGFQMAAPAVQTRRAEESGGDISSLALADPFGNDRLVLQQPFAANLFPVLLDGRRHW